MKVEQSVSADGREPSFDGHPRLDFRWEVLAPPTEEMWEAMRRAAADVGMASMGQDPTVRELNETFAELTGHERALFLPTTTACIAHAWQAMELAGKQVIIEERCHHYWVERFHFSTASGASAVLVAGDKFGAMPLDALERAITRSYYGEVVETGLISIENTHNVCGGTCLSPDYTQDVAKLAHDHDALLFVDGARIFNSAVAQRVPVAALTSPADAVAVSLGKALAAPMGAVLCGSEQLVARVELLARRSGVFAVHKAGIMAAAALVGLRTMVPRLDEDHARARRLAEGLRPLGGISIDLETVQTNFVRVDTSECGISALEFAHQAGRYGLAVHAIEAHVFKMVTSYTTTDADVEEATEIVERVIAELA